MMMEKMTEKAQQAITDANEHAFISGHPEVNSWHLLGALIEQDAGIVPSLFGKLGIQTERVKEIVNSNLDRMNVLYGDGQAQLSADMKAAMQGGFREAQTLGDKFVSTEHLLLGMLENRSSETGE
jgi:ATP-dependent Clp protease ATP-binding subunit ClpB